MIVGGIAFLGMLTEWLLPQLNKDSADFILQMDGAPNHFILQMDGAPNHFTLQMDGAPNHFHRHVREFLNQHLPQRWIGRGTDDDQMLLAWPPPSPDATPCDFFLWGCVKDQVYVPPLPASIPELKVRIRTAIETITAVMLHTVWNELDYRVDVCRITKGAHIEHP